MATVSRIYFYFTSMNLVVLLISYQCFLQKVVTKMNSFKHLYCNISLLQCQFKFIICSTLKESNNDTRKTTLGDVFLD